MFSDRTGPRGSRVGFLDEVRGLCIILMVIYHGLFNIVFLFGWDIPLPGGVRPLFWLMNTAFMQLAQPFVAGIFIFISGVACRYSRSNLKRGLIALGLGLIITVFTLRFMPELPIYFGILHFLGSSMILFALLRPLLDKVYAGLGFLLGLALFVLTMGVYFGGFVGVAGVWTWYIPAAWTDVMWLIPLGFTHAGVDHFPLIPWFFVFLAGAYLGVAFTRRDMPDMFYHSRSRFLSAAGRRTIYIYVLHQPVLYGSMMGIQMLLERFA